MSALKKKEGGHRKVQLVLVVQRTNVHLSINSDGQNNPLQILEKPVPQIQLSFQYLALLLLFQRF